MPNHIKRIARRLRGHTRRLQTLEEDRQPNVTPVVIRRMEETAVTTENVTITAVEDPVGVFDETNFDRSEFGDTSDAGSNTVVHDETVSNTTTIELDEYRAEDISGGPSESDEAVSIVVGTGNVTPEYENRSINNPIVEDGEEVVARLDEYEVSGTTVILNGYLPTAVANGETIVEAGVVSEHGRLFNHAIHTGVEKTNSISITYEATFTFDTASGGT